MCKSYDDGLRVTATSLP
ncbi:predicted protein [Fibroporia radiculosa]|uniref:Uncharacterized protein n=1 Tax=Fibroporia radiculosa TaxID=599839 RepID=J4G703_9APHY|nr:predicted protein [Fibroporia radiculosa]